MKRAVKPTLKEYTELADDSDIREYDKYAMITDYLLNVLLYMVQYSIVYKVDPISFMNNFNALLNLHGKGTDMKLKYKERVE